MVKLKPLVKPSDRVSDEFKLEEASQIRNDMLVANGMMETSCQSEDKKQKSNTEGEKNADQTTDLSSE